MSQIDKFGFHFWVAVSLLVAGLGCSSNPIQKVEKFNFPKGQAFIERPKKEFEIIGHVKSRADFSSLNPEFDESQLCRIYFNKAVKDLVDLAKKKGADAVVDVRSVVFYPDGKFEALSTPECSDDGADGQVLVQGVAVRWKITDILPQRSISILQKIKQESDTNGIAR